LSVASSSSRTKDWELLAYMRSSPGRAKAVITPTRTSTTTISSKVNPWLVRMLPGRKVADILIIAFTTGLAIGAEGIKAEGFEFAGRGAVDVFAIPGIEGNATVDIRAFPELRHALIGWTLHQDFQTFFIGRQTPHIQAESMQ